MVRTWQKMCAEAVLCLMLSACGSSASAPAALAPGECQATTHGDAETAGGKKASGPKDPVIKGYILNTDQSKVYYLPGTQAYKRVKIDTAKGMKYFCTEADAQADGFKKATV